MLKQAIADTSAGKLSIPTQESSTTASPSPERTIGRNDQISGNTYEEKSLAGPLSGAEKEKLIQAAIQRQVSFPLRQWGNADLFNLIAYGESDYIGMENGKHFCLQLLLFVARPEISKAFQEAVDDGLEKTGKLFGFFSDLDDNPHWQEFIDYNRIEWGTDDAKYDTICKRYLTDEELAIVQAPDAEKASSKKSTTPWYMLPEKEENPFTLTDDELVAALDRYYPDVEWPADKRIIATQEKMKWRLTYNEKERLAILNETPEQKQQRLVDAAVYAEFNGPSIPEQIRSVGEIVEAAVKAPKVLGPDTEIQFRWDRISKPVQPLTVDPDDKKPGKSAPKKAAVQSSGKPATKKTTTKKKA